MKSKFRNVTVKNTEFVYWYGWNAGLQMIISRKNTKHCRIELNFPAEEPQKRTQHFWRFYEISVKKDLQEQKLKLVGPRCIAQIINHMLESTDVFSYDCNLRIDSAWYLLEEMGYTEIKPNWLVVF